MNLIHTLAAPQHQYYLLVIAHEQSCSADLASVAVTKFCRMRAKTWRREACADNVPL